MDREFEARRHNALHELYDMEGDRSRKGSVDAPIQELVDLINSHPHMFTTSCCSGRVSCFAEPTEETRAAGKKGGEWVYVSHDLADPDEVLSKISSASAGGSCLVFRMEPFVMHCECRSVEWCAALLGLARQAGFRESGMVPSSRGRYMVGLRCNLRLEIPVADQGLLVTDDYIRYIVTTANHKLKLNEQRHLRMLELMKGMPHQLEQKRAQRGRHSRPGAPQRSHGRNTQRRQGKLSVSQDEPDGLTSRLAQLSTCQEGLLERISAMEAASNATSGASKRPAGMPGKTARRRHGRSHRAYTMDSAAAKSSPDSGWVLLLSKKVVKSVKDSIKTAGWLDTARRAGEQPGGLIGLPIKDELALRLQAEDYATLPFTAAVCEDVKGAGLGKANLTTTKRQSPIQTLRKNVTQLLEAELADPGMTSRLAEQLPTKWERLGDLVLLPAGSCEGAGWHDLPQQTLWETVARSLSSKRVARQAKIANTGTRDSQVELLLGSNGWVEHRESGVLYSLDNTLCMFSSGNVTERSRMGKIDAAGETIVDLFCGIGYYTLPMLKMAGAAKVYACEWNPNAVEALRRNLSLNSVAARCEIRHGDCRQVAPERVADRVVLGLLPSSTTGWLTAVKSLKDTGGTLHVHENIRDVDEATWVAESMAEFARLAGTTGRNFRVAKLHLERVKWYAPHIRHVVLDLSLSPA